MFHRDKRLAHRRGFFAACYEWSGCENGGEKDSFNFEVAFEVIHDFG